jgi:hypothetical protein
MFAAVVGRDVPFAADHGLVAGPAHHLSDGHATPVKIAQVARERGSRIHHVADAGLVRVQAGEKAGAAGTAAGRIAEVREADAGTGQAVDVRRADLAAVTADVAETHVIGKDDDDVGAREGCGKGTAGVESTGRCELYKVPAEDQGLIVPPKELSWRTVFARSRAARRRPASSRWNPAQECPARARHSDRCRSCRPP